LRLRNRDRDLTRLIGFQSIVERHYIDCLIVKQLILLPSPLLDVGSGAGFPGLMLKIALPQLSVVLAEPRPGRIRFLKEAITSLGLRDIVVFEHKVVSRSFTRPMKGVITRAVETMDKTILRTSGCLGVGGNLIFMKGPNVDAEKHEVARRFSNHVRLTLDKAYRIPHTNYDRRILIYTIERPISPASEGER
jgi:16S rRNA (guanine527-N7)-methyltransferase